jgi:hypothetical protein
MKADPFTPCLPELIIANEQDLDHTLTLNTAGNGNEHTTTHEQEYNTAQEAQEYQIDHMMNNQNQQVNIEPINPVQHVEPKNVLNKVFNVY